MFLKMLFIINKVNVKVPELITSDLYIITERHVPNVDMEIYIYNPSTC
jgi:hypothetical protein